MTVTSMYMILIHNRSHLCFGAICFSFIAWIWHHLARIDALKISRPKFHSIHIMGRDFYKILEIPRDASQDQIKKAYRRMAMKWHPDKNHGNEEEAQTRFQEVSTAYEVLSDPDKRALYDRGGEEALNPGSGARYSSRMRPEDLFRQFFGGANPFGSFFGGGGSPFDAFFGGGGDRFGGDDFGFPGMFGSRRAYGRPNVLRKMEPAVLNISVSLDQLFTGTTKVLKYVRHLHGVQNENTFTLEIRPGALEGTKYTFEGEGDIREGYVPQDVIFVVKQLKHPRFDRNKDDLSCKMRISLKEAITGLDRTIEGIDGSMIPVTINKTIKPGFRHRIAGHGMPSKAGGRGDLVIDFDVVFPEIDDPEIKEMLAQLLPDLSE